MKKGGEFPKGFDAATMSPDLRALIDRVIVPALLERFLREHASQQSTSETSAA